jgi:hypothetical protein
MFDSQIVKIMRDIKRRAKGRRKQIQDIFYQEEPNSPLKGNFSMEQRTSLSQTCAQIHTYSLNPKQKQEN